MKLLWKQELISESCTTCSSIALVCVTCSLMYTVKTITEFCRARKYVLNLAIAIFAAFDLYFGSVLL